MLRYSGKGESKLRGIMMKRLLLSTAAVVMFSSAAFAMSVPYQPNLATGPSALIESARIVCEESGQCYRPRGRRPVARWIYGDDAFYGPYDGPRYYGHPGRHYGWSLFGWWW
jgi:hypothetical protein